MGNTLIRVWNGGYVASPIVVNGVKNQPYLVPELKRAAGTGQPTASRNGQPRNLRRRGAGARDERGQWKC